MISEQSTIAINIPQSQSSKPDQFPCSFIFILFFMNFFIQVMDVYPHALCAIHPCKLKINDAFKQYMIEKILFSPAMTIIKSLHWLTGGGS